MTNFHSSPTFLRFFTSWVVVLPLLGLLSLDSFGSQNTVGKLIGVPSYQLVLPALLCLFLIRLKFGTVLDKLTTWMVAFISVMGFLIATVLSALEMVSPPNTVYSLTRLHQSQVLLVAITGGLIFFLNKKNSWWKSHWQKTLFWLPFVFFYVALVTRSFPFDVFHELVKEDKLVENMQFWVLIGGSITSFLTAFRLKSRAAVLPAMVYLFLGLAFLFVAGDEIAWGQRILRIEVSESIKQVNRQDELTVHNLYAFEWLVLYGYLGISAIGLFSRFIFSTDNKVQESRYFYSRLYIDWIFRSAVHLLL